ncbi:tetratricopeptide repeat protein [Candidatus Peribacteria bacterium]|nr:tetratricopeptide repeat protein [Candidatus Peribacteria bacterium]
MNRLRSWLPVLLLVLLPLGIYWTSLGNGFVVWDDDTLVYKNPLVQHFSSYALWAVFTSYDPELYIPLTMFTYQLEHLLFGMNPTVFHVTNLLLHIASSVMVMHLLRRWGLSHQGALVLALIFAVHPMNAEGVAWVSARKDMLSNVLFLSALLQWERYRATTSRRSYRAAAALFGLALLAKVSVALLPIILILIDWRNGRLLKRKTVREIAPFCALSMLFIAIALFGKTTNIASLTPWQTILLATKAVAFYPVKYVLPISLSTIYHQSTPITLVSWEFALPAFSALCILVLATGALHRTRMVAFCVLFFLVMLAPSFANFSKMGSLFFASDRYIGLAQIGILYALGLLWSWCSVRRALIARSLCIVAMVGIIPACAFAARDRSLLWGDSETLFRDAMEKNPNSAVIHFNLAVVEQKRGKYDKALELYGRAIAIRPDFSQAYNNASLIYKEQGDREKAKQWLLEALRIDPENLSALINLASLHLDRGEPDEAIALLNRALEEDPYNVPALSKLGAAYGKKEMYMEGLQAFQKAWRLDPVMHEQSKALEKMLKEFELQGS